MNPQVEEIIEYVRSHLTVLRSKLQHPIGPKKVEDTLIKECPGCQNLDTAREVLPLVMQRVQRQIQESWLRRGLNELFEEDKTASIHLPAVLTNFLDEEVNQLAAELYSNYKARYSTPRALALTFSELKRMGHNTEKKSNTPFRFDPKVGPLVQPKKDPNALFSEEELKYSSYAETVEGHWSHKTSYVKHLPGHENSKGEPAPWVICQHETDKVLSSHKTKEQAEEHLRQMNIHKHSFWMVARPSDKKIEFLMGRYGITAEEMEQFIQADPTENLYVEWLIKHSKAGRLNLSEEKDAIKTALEKFNKTKNSPEFKAEHSPDINRWIPAELIDLFNEKEIEKDVKSEKQKKKDLFKGEDPERVEIVWQDDQWIVYEAKEPRAASIIGSGTSWCTTQLSTAKTYLEGGKSLWIIYYQGKPWAQYSPYGHEFNDWRNRRLGEQPIDKRLAEFLRVCPLPVFDRYRSMAQKVVISAHRLYDAYEKGYTFEEVKRTVSRLPAEEKLAAYAVWGVEAPEAVFESASMAYKSAYLWKLGKKNVPMTPSDLRSVVYRRTSDTEELVYSAFAERAAQTVTSYSTWKAWLEGNHTSPLPIFPAMTGDATLAKLAKEPAGALVSLVRFNYDDLKPYPWFESFKALVAPKVKKLAQTIQRWNADDCLEAAIKLGIDQEEILQVYLDRLAKDSRAVDLSSVVTMMTRRSPAVEELLLEQHDTDGIREYAEHFGLKLRFAGLKISKRSSLLAPKMAYTKYWISPDGDFHLVPSDHSIAADHLCEKAGIEPDHSKHIERSCEAPLLQRDWIRAGLSNGHCYFEVKSLDQDTLERLQAIIMEEGLNEDVVSIEDQERRFWEGEGGEIASVNRVSDMHQFRMKVNHTLIR